MGAREAIIARIRAGLGKPAAADERERAAVQRYLSAGVQHPRPPRAGDPVAHFGERAAGLGSTVEAVDEWVSVPRAVARYLVASGLPLAAVAWPEFAELDWRHEGMDIEIRPAREGDLVGITGACCAIAETGTVVLVSGPAMPVTPSLLPETHVAVISRDRIVAAMEDAWRVLRRETVLLPRAVHFVSGPSRTADIEQTVTLGAHGPYRVHLIVVR